MRSEIPASLGWVDAMRHVEGLNRKPMRRVLTWLRSSAWAPTEAYLQSCQTSTRGSVLTQSGELLTGNQLSGEISGR